VSKREKYQLLFNLIDGLPFSNIWPDIEHACPLLNTPALQGCGVWFHNSNVNTNKAGFAGTSFWSWPVCYIFHHLEMEFYIFWCSLTHLVSGNVSNARLVEQLFIGPIRMFLSQSRCPPVVISEPHDADAE